MSSGSKLSQKANAKMEEQQQKLEQITKFKLNSSLKTKIVIPQALDTEMSV